MEVTEIIILEMDIIDMTKEIIIIQEEVVMTGVIFGRNQIP